MVIRYQLGDLAGVEKHFTAGLKVFDDPGFIQNPAATAVSTFGTASWNAWVLGRAEVARERMAQMTVIANRDNPFHMMLSGHFAAVLLVGLREYERAGTLAAQALEQSEKHQFPQFAAYLRCTLGLVRAQLGRVTEGIGLIRLGLATAGAPSHYRTSYLAAAQELEGATVEALETVEQALQINPGELIYRPETFRLRGELRLKLGQTELAEAGFGEAIALAQSMRAKAWELRATMSLARLLAQQNRRDQARTMLADIYNWFSEGFDTVDLKDAKALLDELRT
jgi:tetratricopeptide (TPR) repeat protein